MYNLLILVLLPVSSWAGSWCFRRFGDGSQPWPQKEMALTYDGGNKTLLVFNEDKFWPLDPYFYNRKLKAKGRQQNSFNSGNLANENWTSVAWVEGTKFRVSFEGNPAVSYEWLHELPIPSVPENVNGTTRVISDSQLNGFRIFVKANDAKNTATVTWAGKSKEITFDKADRWKTPLFATILEAKATEMKLLLAFQDVFAIVSAKSEAELDQLLHPPQSIHAKFNWQSTGILFGCSPQICIDSTFDAITSKVIDPTKPDEYEVTYYRGAWLWEVNHRANNVGPGLADYSNEAQQKSSPDAFLHGDRVIWRNEAGWNDITVEGLEKAPEVQTAFYHAETEENYVIDTNGTVQVWSRKDGERKLKVQVKAAPLSSRWKSTFKTIDAAVQSWWRGEQDRVYFFSGNYNQVVQIAGGVASAPRLTQGSFIACGKFYADTLAKVVPDLNSLKEYQKYRDALPKGKEATDHKTTGTGSKGNAARRALADKLAIVSLVAATVVLLY